MSQSAVPTKPVVTLFEQYGAGADYIGPKLAERFGVQYVGYRWSSEELEQLHATPAEEQTAFDRFMVAAGRGAEPGESTPVHLFQMADNEAVNANSAELNAMAAKGLVVLGHNATVILADHPGALHVKLDGPAERRVAYAAAATGIDQAHAARRLAREDRVRAEFSLALYGWDPRTNDRYHLVVNTSLFGVDDAVRIILAARERVS